MTSFIKIIISIVVTICVSFSIYLVVIEVSGPDFSGDYIATPGSKDAISGSNIRLPYLKMHLVQSDNSFSGHLDVFAKNNPKIRYDIVKGNLDKSNHINLELHFKSGVEANANVGMFGVSAPFAEVEISMRTLNPVKENDVAITFEGLGELGGAMGLVKNVLELMIRNEVSEPKKEVVTFFKVNN